MTSPLIRLVLVLSSLTMITIVGACRGSADGIHTTSESVVATRGAHEKLRDVINLTDPTEITYRWSGSLPNGRPGIVVGRVSSGLNRWDALPDADEPSQGSFNVYRTVSGVAQAFGCIWFTIPSDTVFVNADCGNNSGPPSMDSALAQALLAGSTDHQLAGRTLLGRAATCYVAPPLKEMCMDGNGYLLYVALELGGRAQTFEATSLLDVIEPFGWPPDSSQRTPSTVEEKTPAITLDFPSQFHVGE